MSYMKIGGVCGGVSNFKNTDLYLTQTAPEQSWGFEERFTLEGRDAVLLAQSRTIQKGKELGATHLKMLIIRLQRRSGCVCSCHCQHCNSAGI